MPEDNWNKMKKGDNSLAKYAASLFQEILVSDSGYWIADLERSRVFLNRNQYAKGYCTLVAKQAGIVEAHQMYEHQRRLFFEDMMRVAAGLEKAFNTTTINYLIIGNDIPHLHVQIVPRYYGDPLPQKAIDPDAETIHLSDEEYRNRVADIREAMGFSPEIYTDDNLLKFMDEKARIKDWPPLKLAESQKAVRDYLASKFEPGIRYTEKEVNAILNTWAIFDDPALLRRELIMHDYMRRMKDGSAYWLDEG